MIYTDQSTMPFGEYRGQKLANVPASRLIWLFENNLRPGPLKDYIEKNLEWLKREAKMNARNNKR